MTYEDIKKAYGDETGYIFCENCPLCDDKGNCIRDLTNVCDGRNYAYKVIHEHCDLADPVNHPSHYTMGGMECIDEMILIFGKEAVKHFCICNAWKYRKRAMFKNGQEDMDKSDWYINKYKELTADEAV